MNKKTRIIIGALTFVILAIGIFTLLVWNGVIILNNTLAKRYPVRGVDVSAYQGEIDWEVLSSQDISFAFIKATEGSSFVDRYFDYNYTQAQKTNLRIGAYHFFSFDSSGTSQAENFIKNVEKCDNMLPPVIDFEFYGDKEKNPPAQSDVRQQLDALIKALETHYGMKPLLYATEESYSMYLANAYEDYDIWIRNVISAPKLSDNRDWTFWQYTNRERIDGYKGEEKYIDMNVFYGTIADFEKYSN